MLNWLRRENRKTCGEPYTAIKVCRRPPRCTLWAHNGEVHQHHSNHATIRWESTGGAGTITVYLVLHR